jgi:predicted esterase
MIAGPPTIHFNHGKESGPWGSKIKAMAEVGRQRGLEVSSLDYSDLADPSERVERLVRSGAARGDILVGSSMGAYVATVASQQLRPRGLFLLAPAFFVAGFPVAEPVPHAPRVSLVHGWGDDVVPVSGSLRFAEAFRSCTHFELHLVPGDHRLGAQLPLIEMLFGRFLDQVLADAG